MFTVPQIVLIILWFTLYNVITSATGFGLVAGGVVLNGLATGLIMGDVATGFYLGGTYELMNIGLNPLGGSTVPNYNMGVVVRQRGERPPLAAGNAYNNHVKKKRRGELLCLRYLRLY